MRQIRTASLLVLISTCMGFDSMRKKCVGPYTMQRGEGKPIHGFNGEMWRKEPPGRPLGVGGRIILLIAQSQCFWSIRIWSVVLLHKNMAVREKWTCAMLSYPISSVSLVIICCWTLLRMWGWQRCTCEFHFPWSFDEDLCNLMFLWPCIMNWPYNNYQRDALNIIYS